MRGLVVLILFLLFSLSSFAQVNKGGIINKNDFKFGIVFLKSGDTLKGFIKVKSNYTLKYKDHFEGNKRDIIANDVRKIEFGPIIYEFKSIKGKSLSKKLLLESYVSVHNVTLFKEVLIRTSALGIDGKLSGGYSFDPVKHYYLGKNNESSVSSLGKGNIYSKSFGKIASEYFEGCDKLLKKIKQREFERFDLDSVMEMYDSECGR